MKFNITEMHISMIRPGDTVEHNGHLITVCRGDIRRGFMGTTIFCDSYKLGTVPVRLAKIFRAMPTVPVPPFEGDAA